MFTFEKKAASRTKNGLFENWLPVVEAYRTLFTEAIPEMRIAFDTGDNFR